MSEAEYLEIIEQLEQTIWDCVISLNLAGNILIQEGMSAAGDVLHNTAIRALDAIGEDVVNLPKQNAAHPAAWAEGTDNRIEAC